MTEQEATTGVLEPETEQERPSRRDVLVGLAKFALAGLILYILFHRGEIRWSQIGLALSHWGVALAVTGLTFISYYGQGFRWMLLLRSRSVHLGSWDAFRYLLTGKFFNLAVPGYFSEDVVRGLYLIRNRKASRALVVVSLMVDRAAGVFTMLLFCAGGLLLRSDLLEDSRIRTLMGICLAGIGGTFAGIFFLRLMEQPPELLRRLAELLRLHIAVDKMYAEARHYALNVRLQGAAVALTLINQGLMLWGFALFGGTLGMKTVTATDYVVFVPLGILATMLPVAPVGLGVGHVAFLTLFKFAGSGEGANLFSLYTLVVILVSLVGGLFYLAKRARPGAAGKRA